MNRAVLSTCSAKGRRGGLTPVLARDLKCFPLIPPFFFSSQSKLGILAAYVPKQPQMMRRLN